MTYTSRSQPSLRVVRAGIQGRDLEMGTTEQVCWLALWLMLSYVSWPRDDASHSGLGPPHKLTIKTCPRQSDVASSSKAFLFGDSGCVK